MTVMNDYIITLQEELRRISWAYPGCETKYPGYRRTCERDFSPDPRAGKGYTIKINNNKEI